MIHEMKNGEVREFACGEMEGRYVTVVLPGKGKYLSLCEVEVHGGTTRKITSNSLAHIVHPPEVSN